MTQQERTDAIIMLSNISQQAYNAMITTAKKMDAEALVKDVNTIIDYAQTIVHMIGYANDDTDAHETTDTTLVTPKDIRTAKFNMTRFREGYDPDDVDRLLDKCAMTIQVLTAKLAELVAGRTAGDDK